MVRRISSWAWKKEIATCDGLAVLKGLEMDESKMDIKIQQDPALAQWIAKCFASMVADSPNYTSKPTVRHDTAKSAFDEAERLAAANPGFPFFIVAYWSQGGWWKIHKELYSRPDCEKIQADIKDLQSRGWSHITIMRLPLTPNEQAHRSAPCGEVDRKETQ